MPMPSEAERFSDGVVVRRRVRADFLELADVVRPGGRGRRERPQRRDMFAAHVEEAGADGRQEPLVQAGPVEVAAEVARLVGKVRKRVCAVDHGLYAAPACFVADPLHRKDLTGEVGDVAEVQHFRRRCDRGEQAVRQHVERGRRNRE